MYPTLPVDDEYHLASLLIDVYDDLADQSSKEPFLCALIGLRVIPQGFEIAGEILELINRADAGCLRTFGFDADASFDDPYFFKGNIPSPFEFLSNQAIVRICGLVLPLSASGAILCGFEIAAQRIQDLRVNLGLPFSCHNRCLYRCGLNYA
jgi:hypothetical protein